MVKVMYLQFNKLMGNLFTTQVFCDWSWEILTCLRLHQLDQPEPWVHAVIASPALMLKDIPDPTNSAITQGYVSG